MKGVCCVHGLHFQDFFVLCSVLHRARVGFVMHRTLEDLVYAKFGGPQFVLWESN